MAEIETSSEPSSLDSARSGTNSESPDLFSYANQVETSMVPSISQESLRQLQPLAERLRPGSFNEILDIPEHLRLSLDRGIQTSFIFWGPPGSGKTSLISLLKAKHFIQSKPSSHTNIPSHSSHSNYSSRSSNDTLQAPWYEFLASDVTIKDLRSLIEKAQLHFRNQRRASVLVLDEIHRLNRVHQDALLPSLEKGEIILLGGTTENPLTCLSKALISRCRLWNLRPLSPSSMKQLYRRAQIDLGRTGSNQSDLIANPGTDSEAYSETHSGQINPRENTSSQSEDWLSPAQLDHLIQRSHGDARLFLRELHTLHSRNFGKLKDNRTFGALSLEDMDSLLGQQDLGFEPGSSDQSQAISGLIKTMRASDPDRALGWLALMLHGRVDLLYICRRLMIFASEDVGNADPRALSLATDAAKATELVGLPEAKIIISQAVCYLASAPKSRASYEAIGKAEDWIRTQPILKRRETLAPGSQLPLPNFYEPTSSGFEKNIKELNQWRMGRQPTPK